MILHDQAHDHDIVGYMQEWSSANVSTARNNLTRRFVDEYDAEWLMWIDSDMAWTHDAVHQLLSVADPVRAPIVGGLCFGAAHDVLFPTIYQLVNLDGEKLTTIRVEDFPEDSMVQCSATGAAFLMIHRSVLVTMRERNFNPAFEWFQETEVSGDPAGEDITFGLRAGLCGFPVYVHTGIKVGHHKSHLLTNDIYQAQREALRETEAAES